MREGDKGMNVIKKIKFAEGQKYLSVDEFLWAFNRRLFHIYVYVYNEKYCRANACKQSSENMVGLSVKISDV